MGWLCQSTVLNAFARLCKLSFSSIGVSWKYTALCSVPNTLMFPTWPPRRHRVARGTWLFRAANTLAENLNVRNQSPLTTLWVVSSAWMFRSLMRLNSAALCVGPNSRSCFSSVERRSLAVITGYEARWKIWHTQTTCNLAAKSFSQRCWSWR